MIGGMDSIKSISDRGNSPRVLELYKRERKYSFTAVLY